MLQLIFLHTHALGKNPWAVIFASFGLEQSIWIHPLLGYTNGVVLFLKNQV